MVNDSLFVFCGGNCNSILKWNSENKTLTTFCDMYNKMTLGAFATIYNHKNNCLLFFGGIVCGGLPQLRVSLVDYILEFNMKNKQWNKLPISLPTKMDCMCCTMAINNKYILLFGGLRGYERNSCVSTSDNIYVYSMKH
eukprot:210116_1